MFKIDFGKVKAWADIARYYYGWIMSTITGFGMLKLLGFQWLLLVIIFFSFLPLIIGIVYLHMKYIYPKEQEYIWMKNPVVKKLLKKEK